MQLLPFLNPFCSFLNTPSCLIHFVTFSLVIIPNTLFKMFIILIGGSNLRLLSLQPLAFIKPQRRPFPPLAFPYLVSSFFFYLLFCFLSLFISSFSNHPSHPLYPSLLGGPRLSIILPPSPQSLKCMASHSHSLVFSDISFTASPIFQNELYSFPFLSPSHFPIHSSPYHMIPYCFLRSAFSHCN